jgi:hypothetical protein
VGVAGSGLDSESDSGLDVIVERDTKKSIGVDVCVVPGSRCYENMTIKLSFYTFKPRTRKGIAEDCIIHNMWANGQRKVQHRNGHDCTIARAGK